MLIEDGKVLDSYYFRTRYFIRTFLLAKKMPLSKKIQKQTFKFLQQKYN